jgi:hypothetical protein
MSGKAIESFWRLRYPVESVAIFTRNAFILRPAGSMGVMMSASVAILACRHLRFHHLRFRSRWQTSLPQQRWFFTLGLAGMTRRQEEKMKVRMSCPPHPHQ